jgi:Spy/CpxP family protein refolding chaperone
MKRTHLVLMIILAVTLSAVVCFAEDSGNNYCPWGNPGSGYRGHMTDRDWRMYGHGWRYENGMMSGWKTMTPKQLKQFDELWGAYLKDTLWLRQQVASKQLALEMLWHQPQMDEEKIGKLSGELADLETQLKKKHDQYLLKCRKQFGDQTWACPGSRW